MDNIYDGRLVRTVFGEEPTFGTPLANNGTFKATLLEPVAVNRDVRPFELPGAPGVTGLTDSNMILLTSGSMPTFNLSGPATVFNIHEFAYLYFQAVEEQVGAGQGKYFFSNASGSIQPDFTADEGHFVTVINKYRDPASDTADLAHKYTSVISNAFKVSVEEDGYWKYDGGCVAKGAGTTDNDTSTATIVEPQGGEANYGAVDFWTTTHAQIDFIDGNGYQEVVLHKFEAEITQDVIKEGPGGDEKTFTHYGLLNRHMGTFSIEILKDTQAETATSQYAIGKAIKVIVARGGMDVPAIGDIGVALRGKITDITYPGAPGEKTRAVISGVLSKDINETDPESFRFAVNNGLTESW